MAETILLSLDILQKNIKMRKMLHNHVDEIYPKNYIFTISDTNEKKKEPRCTMHIFEEKIKELLVIFGRFQNFGGEPLTSSWPHKSGLKHNLDHPVAPHSSHKVSESSIGSSKHVSEIFPSPSISPLSGSCITFR